MSLKSLCLAAGAAAALVFAATAPAFAPTYYVDDEPKTTPTHESTGAGPARLDLATTPAEIALGKMKAIFRLPSGLETWIDRVQDGRVSLGGATRKLRFTAKWVLGNELVVRKADLTFRVRVFRVVTGGNPVLVASADKHATVDGKGLGGTKYKDGVISTPEIAVSSGDQLRIRYDMLVGDMHYGSKATLQFGT
jgi:hypothetical protein